MDLPEELTKLILREFGRVPFKIDWSGDDIRVHYCKMFMEDPVPVTYEGIMLFTPTPSKPYSDQDVCAVVETWINYARTGDDPMDITLGSRRLQSSHVERKVYYQDTSQ
jgi:hypothetical protein